MSEKVKEETLKPGQDQSKKIYISNLINVNTPF